MDGKVISENMRRIAKAAGLSLADVAELSGVHEVTLSRWQSGCRPHRSSVLAVAWALSVKPEELMKGA